MANGKPGDHPISDMTIHGAHPFPTDMEKMILRLRNVDPALLDKLEGAPFEWERAELVLRKGRERLRELLRSVGLDPDVS